MYNMGIMAKRLFDLRRQIAVSFMLLLLSILVVVFSSKNTAAATISQSHTPTIISSFTGSNNQLDTPPSPTIAANKNETLQLLNGTYLIRKNTGVVKSGTVASLINTPNTFTGDPQVLWDGSTNRFYFSYYEYINNNGVGEPGIAWGYSKTANPSSPTSFCTYFNPFNYGSTFYPDRQNLGDTKNFLLISSNRYSLYTNYIQGSDLAYIAKPPAGNTCVAGSTLSSGIQSLKNPDGVTSPWMPTPAKQVDPLTTGYVIGVPSYVSGSTLTEYAITENLLTKSIIIGSPTSISIPSYTFPHYAPQAGKTIAGNPAPPLETQTYLAQTMMAYDPRVNGYALWTAQTDAGGAGTKVDWYEINPSASSLYQTGTIQDPNLSIFNAAISPDRVYVGTKGHFGNSAVITFNTSSINTYPAIDVISIVNGQPESAMQLIQQSTGPYVDFTCSTSAALFCRWGDYPGAVPNPASNITGATNGQILITNQWNLPSINDNTLVWQTLIANINP
jgi:hypothetical protein